MTTPTEGLPVIDEAKEREAFAAWFASGRRSDPDFNNIVTQFMLEAWLARSRQQETGWIACSERMPEALEPVLFMAFDGIKKGYYVTDTWEEEGYTPRHHWAAMNFTCGDDYEASEVTHWQPLPPPPGATP